VRYVVLGAGAVGGTLGISLAESGGDVVLIARNEHARAVRQDGLTLRTPVGSRTTRFDVFESPEGVGWRDQDVLLLCVKSQDTVAALAAVPTHVPIVCAQNGVTNEPAAAERFEDVYGMMVWTPAVHLHPGVVAAYAEPAAVLRLGSYAGPGNLAEPIAADLTRAGLDAEAVADIMQIKHGKLLGNLGNVLDAYCIRDDSLSPMYRAAMAEGGECLRAAGIAFMPRRELFDDMQSRMTHGKIDGEARPGGSTWQSAARNTATELPYLNGYICELGTKLGMPTPVNDALMRIAATADAPRSIRISDYWQPPDPDANG